jgi:hypothetical protein
MAVYKIFANSDATLYSAYKGKNTGLDEILEIAVKNSNATTNGTYLSNAPEDLRRSVVKFSSSDIQKIKSFTTGSWKTYLRLYLAEAENLTTNYNIEIRQLSQSWDMGTGKFSDYPDTVNGVSWYSTGSYKSSNPMDWINANYYTVPGGGSWTNLLVTQSFDYEAPKDICADVTTISNSWFSGSNPNYGFLLKHTGSVENNASSYIVTKFFSVDTHTIYPPTLEIRWDDSVYITGSSTVSNNNFVINTTNNTQTYKYGTEKYRIKLSARDKYPTRQFTTSSIYLSNKLLPSSSYWAIQDFKTEEIIIDFDTNYTKISSDGLYNYFDLYMNGLEPERYYKILVKTVLPTQETIEIDSNSIFKIVR